MKIIPANFKLSSFKTMGGDRGDRRTEGQHTLSGVNGNEKSILSPSLRSGVIIILIIWCMIDSGDVDQHLY